jgi:hypothetical protein
MPEQTISPGVFTEERDQTFLQQGVQEIGGAFVGPSQKGPAFKPVEVQTPQGYEEQFGDEGLYMDYSVKNYLRDASSATVVRLLGEEGYESEGVEIQLPQGELSSRPFEITKTEFSFGTEVGPDEEIDVRVCFRGRQRRTSSTEVLDYDISVHEYVDGDYNAEVISEQNVDQDCFDATFTPETDEFVSVRYEVEVELADGQSAKVESPAVQVQGFYLEDVRYNWVEGKNKGNEEIVSLLGDVQNIDGTYDAEVYEVVNGTLKEDPVATRTGLTDSRFRLAFVHGGATGDRLTYVVKVQSGGVEDVPDSVSPSIDVIDRGETAQFEILDVNFNFVQNQDVDYREKLQVDAEASRPVQTDALDALLADGTQDEAQSGQNALDVVSGDPNNTSVYLEFQVGDSGIDVSTGDIVSYILQLTDTESAGPDDEIGAESPEVEVDGGLFRIGEVDTNFDEGDKVGGNEESGISFTVVNENSSATPFNFTIFEIEDGDDQNETAVVQEADISDSDPRFTNGRLTTGVATSASFNRTVQYRIQVEQTASQGASISSTDSRRTPTQTVTTLEPVEGNEIGIQKARFGLFDRQTAKDGDVLFGGFAVDEGSAISYTYEIELYKNGESTESIVLSDGSNAAHRYFENWQVGDASGNLYDGDEFFYRFRVEDGSGNTAFVDSPTLTYSGGTNPNFGIEETDFQFEDGAAADVNERLSVNFETRRPSWDTGDQYGLRYKVIGYVNGSTAGTVVADTLSEEGNDIVTQGDGTASEPQVEFEASWFAGNDTTASIGDNIKYELVVEQYDIANDSVLQENKVMGGTVSLAERTPKEDVTLAVLAPTERLRRDADEITDVQINPDKSDMANFELILGLESTSDSGGETPEMQSAGEDEGPVESLLSDADSNNLTQSQDLLIDGRSYQVSLKEGESNYLLDLFGRNVESPTEVFAKSSFPEVWEELIGDFYDEETGTTGINLKAEFDPAKFDFDGQGYSNAETPWIVSQDQQPNQPGAERQRLFKFETIGDGNYANREIKASITNVRYPSEVSGSEYGEFDVLIRDIGDKDRSPTILESFSGVNLNPDSQNYIGRAIGNKKTELNSNGKLIESGGEAGVFENRSNYIRVDVNRQVVRANSGGRNDLANLVPWGFAPYQIPLDYGGQVPHGLKPRLVQSINDVENDILPENGINQDISSVAPPFDDRIFFGVDFEFEGNLSWLQAIANNSDSASEQAEFEQDYGFVLSDAYVENPDGNGVRQIEYGDNDAEGLPVGRRKFNIAFQGGFDGMEPAKPKALEDEITPSNAQGLDLSTANAAGTQAYEKAIRLLGNEDRFDINLLVTPGVINSLHSPVIQAGIDMVESRADTFYAFDAAGLDASVDDAVASVQSVDSSYAATYFPWLRIRDQNRNKQVRVPPSVLIPRVYAFNDQTSAEWFAPAGFERGGIPEAISAVLRLRKEDRDELYRNRVNPIAQFPDQGVSVWGQKTLQTQAGALDRVNVRRLLIRVKKFIASTSRFLVFEQNVPETRNRFLNIVRPFLDQVQQQNGVFAFRVKMDAENNPPEVVDRNKLVGEIFLQPTRTAEYIELTFNVLPTGAEFEDV